MADKQTALWAPPPPPAPKPPPPPPTQLWSKHTASRTTTARPGRSNSVVRERPLDLPKASGSLWMPPAELGQQTQSLSRASTVSTTSSGDDSGDDVEEVILRLRKVQSGGLWQPPEKLWKRQEGDVGKDIVVGRKRNVIVVGGDGHVRKDRHLVEVFEDHQQLQPKPTEIEAHIETAPGGKRNVIVVERREGEKAQGMKERHGGESGGGPHTLEKESTESEVLKELEYRVSSRDGGVRMCPKGNVVVVDGALQKNQHGQRSGSHTLGQQPHQQQHHQNRELLERLKIGGLRGRLVVTVAPQ